MMMLGALSWIATLQFFVALAIASIGAIGYSAWSHDVSFLGISDCGPFTDPMSGEVVNVCSPRHAVFNSGLASLGACIAAGAVLTGPFWGDNHKARIGLTMIAAGGLGGLAAGLWPVDVNVAIHGIGALLNFTIGKLGLLLLGWGIVRERPQLGRSAIAVALVALGAVIAYGLSDSLGLPRGAIERLATWPETLWFIAAGYTALAALLRGNVRADKAER